MVPPENSSTYFRKGFGLKAEVQGVLSADYDGRVVDLLRERDYTLAAGGLTVRLAREFGFCYGVERAVEYAYQTRRKFPDRRLFLVGEIIHNPHDFERLRAIGCVLVDTTCGSVLNVWKRVESYARDGFTALIHGKHYHEETRATASQVLKFPEGRYLVVRDMEEARAVCDYIEGRSDRAAFLGRFAHAA